TETLANRQVEVVRERAVLTGDHHISLADGRTVTARTILVATGASPVIPDVPGSELGITSNEAFHLESVPKRIVIAGAGYIANEFAGIFHQFGSHVTVVNRSDVILRGYDAQIRDRLLQIALMKGIEFRFNVSFEHIENNGNGMMKVHMDGCDPLEADAVMFAMGRRPNTTGLGLEALGVEIDSKAAVVVDADNKSTVDHIYA